VQTDGLEVEGLQPEPEASTEAITPPEAAEAKPEEKAAAARTYTEQEILPLFQELQNYRKFGSHDSIAQRLAKIDRLVEAVAPQTPGPKLSEDDLAAQRELYRLGPGLEHASQLTADDVKAIAILRKLGPHIERLPEVLDFIRMMREETAIPAAEGLRKLALEHGAPDTAIPHLDKYIAREIEGNPEYYRRYYAGGPKEKEALVAELSTGILKALYQKREIAREAALQATGQAVRALPAASQRTSAPAGAPETRRKGPVSVSKAAESAWEFMQAARR